MYIGVVAYTTLIGFETAATAGWTQGDHLRPMVLMNAGQSRMSGAGVPLEAGPHSLFSEVPGQR